jgi:hypothetical protein
MMAGGSIFAPMPRGRWYLSGVAVAAVAAAAFGTPNAAASGVACYGCSGTYSGTWTATITASSPEGMTTAMLSVDWTETLTAVSGANSVWSLAQASGSISFDNTADPTDNCNASLSPNQAVAPNVTEFAPQVLQTGTSIAVSAEPPTYWSGNPSADPEPLDSTDATDPGCYFTNDTAYEQGFWTSFTGSACHYNGGSEVMTFPLNATSTIYDNCDASGTDAQDGTGTATLKSQLTITPPGLCPPPPSLRRARTAPIAGTAAAGGLTASVTGLSRGFTGALSVLAIAAGDGEVVAPTLLGSRTTRTVFRLPSDRYAILANAVSPSGRRHSATGIRGLVTIRAGRSAKSTIALGGTKGARDVPAAERSADIAATTGPVVTVNGVDMTFADGTRVPFDVPVLVGLFPSWHDQDGIRFVDTSKEFTDFATREQMLSDTHRLAPPPYHFNPLTPDFVVSGSGRIDANRRMTITIVVRRRCDAQVVSQATVTRRLSGKFGTIRYVIDIIDTLNKALQSLQPPTASGGCDCA